MRKDGGPDGRGVGFYYRNVTELVLFGTRGKLANCFKSAGRRMVNISCDDEGSLPKPDEFYDMIEHCRPAPYLELFARSTQTGLDQWGDEIPLGGANGSAKEKVHRVRWKTGMIRPYRMPQIRLFPVPKASHQGHLIRNQRVEEGHLEKWHRLERLPIFIRRKIKEHPMFSPASRHGTYPQPRTHPCDICPCAPQARHPIIVPAQGRGIDL